MRPLLSEHADFLPEEPLGESLLLSDTAPSRVWIPRSRIIVLGRSQQAEKEIHLDHSRADAIPVFQRRGGGGCVVLDSHSLCIGIRYPRLKELNVADYLGLSSRLIASFLQEEYALPCAIRENYDLTVADRKFLGASLYMPRECALYLCVILVQEAGLDPIERYLGMPSKVPSHRSGRSHRDFLLPLQQAGVGDIHLLRRGLEAHLQSPAAAALIHDPLNWAQRLP